MSTFSELTDSIRGAVAGLPEKKAEWDKLRITREVLIAAKGFADVAGDEGNSDIAEELGVIAAFHALPDIPEIPELSPEPGISDEVLKMAEEVRNVLKATSLLDSLGVDKEDVAAANALLDEVAKLRPKVTIATSSRKRRTPGTAAEKAQDARPGRLFAYITYADGTSESIDRQAERDDTLRWDVRVLIGDGGANPDNPDVNIPGNPAWKAAFTSARDWAWDHANETSATFGHEVTGAEVSLMWDPEA